MSAVNGLSKPPVCSVGTETVAYADGIQEFRQRRLQRLTAADGWLSLIGLPWLEPGTNTIGSAADNGIAVHGLPAHFGHLDLSEEKVVHFTLATPGSGDIDGEPKMHAELLDDSHPHPTLVRSGNISFHLVRRGLQIGLRIRNADADTRRDFLGLEHFPIDSSWRIEARWERPEPGESLEMSTVIGSLEQHSVAGHAVFERNGHRCQLLPVIESPDAEVHFLVFADQTSGKETYGAARFLYTEPPQGDRIVLDFNKAYNPPCAFTAFATCPMAPLENRLPLRVTAGELKYCGCEY